MRVSGLEWSSSHVPAFCPRFLARLVIIDGSWTMPEATQNSPQRQTVMAAWQERDDRVRNFRQQFINPTTATAKRHMFEIPEQQESVHTNTNLHGRPEPQSVRLSASRRHHHQVITRRLAIWFARLHHRQRSQMGITQLSRRRLSVTGRILFW